MGGSGEVLQYSSLIGCGLVIYWVLKFGHCVQLCTYNIDREKLMSHVLLLLSTQNTWVNVFLHGLVHDL